MWCHIFVPKMKIGESFRIYVRINEHQNNMKKKKIQKQKICEHAWGNGYSTDFKNTTTLPKKGNNINQNLLFMIVLQIHNMESPRYWLSMIGDEMSWSFPWLLFWIVFTTLPTLSSTKRYLEAPKINSRILIYCFKTQSVLTL